jgi:uncharacterized protein (TIGR02757 family)
VKGVRFALELLEGTANVSLTRHARELEAIYRKHNRREFVHPDPLEFLYEYHDPADREVVGLIASALAYGRVAQILRSVRAVLDALGPHPAKRLRRTAGAALRRRFAGFRHRFHTGSDLAALLIAISEALRRHGSLEECFLNGFVPRDGTVVPALSRFVRELNATGDGRLRLLSDPADGSACKRLNLFLRWMVRSDEVDVGAWRGVPARALVIPLDTHMHRIGLALSATARKQADLRTAMEITAAFQAVSPEDPVRYDFALTRLGIHPDGDVSAFLRRCGLAEVRRCSMA